MRTAEINGQIYANIEDLKEAIKEHLKTIKEKQCISDDAQLYMYSAAHDHIIYMIEAQTNTDRVTLRTTPATEEDREKLKKLFQEPLQDPLPVEIDITEQDQRQLAAWIVNTMPRIIDTMAAALPRIIGAAIDAIEKMSPEELIRIATEGQEAKNDKDCN